MSNIIGVLAGMGPRSTAPFIELLLDQCQLQYGAKYDMDYPEILGYSLPTPFYIGRELNHEEMERTISDGLKKLESWGVDFIAMPCNSAHVYFRDLSSKLQIPLLNIVEESIKNLPEELKKITVFATESTMTAELYQEGLIRSGREFCFQSEWQVEINRIIQEIKEKTNFSQTKTLWDELVKKVEGTGIQGIMVACTDLTVLFKGQTYELPIIDSSEALAKATIEKYLRNRKIRLTEK